MDATALYYTFSTIAQTLAGAFAVLAAFVLFRLPAIEKTISSALDQFARYKQYIQPEEVLRIVLDEGFDALERRMRTIEKERNTHFFGVDDSIRGHVAGIRFWWRRRKSALRWLRLALITTAITIALCFIVLPNVPALSCSVGWSRVVVVTIVVLSLTCLVMYYRLIAALIFLREAAGPP
jgi:hypothetical protein